MAKQTFSVGQTLTAAQMTSLQQTAMLGGAASAKTASYTLVAADAGTAISMSNASATTITVNTGLFAAGDTVQITNLGAGICTITAGTATVNSSASLALAQYESGTLDFTSASAAIFIKGAGAAATGSTTNFTLLNAGGTTLSGSSTTISSISASQIFIFCEGSTINDLLNISITFNGDSGSNYISSSGYWDKNNGKFIQESTAVSSPKTEISLARMDSTATGPVGGWVHVVNADSTNYKQFNSNGTGGYLTWFQNGLYKGTSAITSVSAVSNYNNFPNGKIYVYTTP